MLGRKSSSFRRFFVKDRDILQNQKEKDMTNTKKTVAALALVGSLAAGASSAFAWGGCASSQPVPPCAQADCQGARAPRAMPHPYMYGPGCEVRAPMHRGHQGGEFGLSREDRRALLLGRLNLKDSQKPAWDAYLAAVDAGHEKTVRGAEPMDAKPMTTQERLDAHIARLKARIAKMEAIAKARADFVKVLTADQVKTLEAFEDRIHKPGKRVRPLPPKAPVAPEAVPDQAGRL
jgi:hypothetical protein